MACPLLFGLGFFLLSGFGEVKHQWMLLVIQEEQSHTDKQGEDIFFQFPQEFLFQVLCFHSKLLLYRAPAPGRGLIVQGGDGMYVWSCFLWISSSYCWGLIFLAANTGSPGDIIFLKHVGAAQLDSSPQTSWNGKMNAKLSVWPKVIRWIGVDRIVFLRTGCRLGGLQKKQFNLLAGVRCQQRAGGLACCPWAGLCTLTGIRGLSCKAKPCCAAPGCLPS